MTSTIFLTVAIVATAIFLIQFIVSIFFGDIDTDVDVDADLGSILSFKGLTHFCIGMGWYMYISQGTDITSYAIGILVGLIFVLVLWYLYKKAWQLQKENKPEKLEALQGRECTIYAHDGERYVVQVAVNGALREMDVRSLEDRKYQTGDRTMIVKVESGIMYIQ
ncbi:hypothetical protein H8784_08215 [Parabacteroides acidifaciens]|uniref:NfeD-like C-terminal domain-containing protein n=1 Tax=Parabacteroides acidifaciens TaxID=2290935 RepID=A0A3D8HEZ2_9BACT|nr:hypothetical protein [Parabacteroides acidifaciens]MBC8601706.1 hypothetical protein [Parabacteroides acidifaciens]RDU49539.1 hypothetical protein DWU89_08405 [Parabacteroides acidifaciens]